MLNYTKSVKINNGHAILNSNSCNIILTDNHLCSKTIEVSIFNEKIFQMFTNIIYINCIIINKIYGGVFLC